MTDDEMQAAGYTRPAAPQQSSDVMTDDEMQAAGYTRPAAPQQSSDVMTDDEMQAAGYTRPTDTSNQTGVLGAIPSGIAAGVKSLVGGAEELGGNRDQAPEAPPSFTGTTAQITHGIFSSIPALIAGLGAGALATAAGAATLPVLGAGALGYGIVNGIQSLYNEYQANLQKNGGDKDEAFTDAAKVATIDAGGGAVSWAAFGAGAPATAALKPILKHIFTQAAAVQPGIGMATQAASNLARGDDITEGVLQAGAQNAALTAVLMAGHAGVSAVGGHIQARGEAADATSRADELAKLKSEQTMETQPDLPFVKTPPGGDTRLQGDLQPAENYRDQTSMDVEQPPSDYTKQGELGLKPPVDVADEQGEMSLQPGERPATQLELNYTPRIPATPDTAGTAGSPPEPQGARREAVVYPKDNAQPATPPPYIAGPDLDLQAALNPRSTPLTPAEHQQQGQGEMPLVQRPDLPRTPEQGELLAPEEQQTPQQLDLVQRPPVPAPEPQQGELPMDTQLPLLPNLPEQLSPAAAAARDAGKPVAPPPAAQAAMPAGGENAPDALPAAAQAAIASSKAVKATWSPYNTLLGRMFGPRAISPAAQDMATRIREAGGIDDARLNILAKNMDPFEKILNGASEADRVALVLARDTGDHSNLRPDLRPLADIMGEASRETRDLALASLPDADQVEWLTNYIKHHYEKTGEGPDNPTWFLNQGSGSSLAPRAFPDYATAAKHGYQMAQRVKDNPIGTFLEDQTQTRAYIKDVQFKSDLVDDGLGVWVDKGDATHPKPEMNLEGMTALNGRDGGPAKGGAVLMVPDDMARLYNNSVSKAFAFWPDGADGADMIHKVSNVFNQWLLAGPLFHGSMTVGESFVNKMMLAVGQGLHGDIGAAGKAVAQLPIAPISHYMLGAEGNRAVLNPGTTTPAMQKAIDYLTRARASFGKNYDPTMNALGQRSFQESIRTGSLMREWNDALARIGDSDGRVAQAKQTMNEVGGLIGKTLQSIGAPLFENIIPNIKTGINLEQFLAWMKIHGEPASDMEHLKAAQRIADGTDSSLGEMRYDNLFWNKTLTQIMQTYVLAPSYTAGTLNLLGGGGATLAGDVAKSIRTLRPQTRASLGSVNYDPRASYVLALPLTVMLTNAIYQYIKTGSGPSDLTDLLLGPKTGGKTTDGHDERAALPGYWRQVLGAYNNPLGEAYNKLGALPKAAIEVTENKDYRGKDIADPRDGVVKRLFDYSMHVAKGNIPIAAQNLQRGNKIGSNISTGETLGGIRDAGMNIENPGRAAALKAGAARRDIQSRNRSDRRLQGQYQQ
jgi:hypothetical protein